GLRARHTSRTTPDCGSDSPLSTAISDTMAMSSSAHAMVCSPQAASEPLVALLVSSAWRSATMFTSYVCARDKASWLATRHAHSIWLLAAREAWAVPMPPVWTTSEE